MKVSILLFLITSIFVTEVSHSKSIGNRKIATQSNACTMTEWPYENLSLSRKDKVTLKEVDLSILRSYFLNESTRKSPRAKLLQDLADLLISLDPSAEMRSFYELVLTATEANSGNPQTLPRSEVCNLLSKVEEKLPRQ